MGVRPLAFNPDGSIDVVFDERGHTGTLPAAEVAWNKRLGGPDDHNVIVLTCPDGCGAFSAWPVGGGPDAVNGQQMFVQKTQREGCACGQVAAGRSDGVPESHVRLNCNRQDGPGRWQLDDSLQVVVRSAPFNFQVVYQDVSGLIIGLEPAGGVGPDLAVAVLHDIAEYEALQRYDPAYLSADKEHIVSTPRG